MLSIRKKTLDEAVPMALDQLDRYVKQPLNPSRSGTGGDQGRYGAVCIVEGKLELKHQQHPCHAFMRNYKDAVVVFNQYPHREGKINKTADRDYFDWITSDTGPWKEFPNRLVTESPVGQAPNKDWIFKNGWVWTNLEVPANLQHSFLTAARMSGEWPDLINKWHTWVSKYNLHPAMAFLFLTLFVPNGITNLKEYHQIMRTNKYDWPVDICTAGEEYVTNFCSGKVSGLIQNYSRDPQYRPVNAIFGKTDLGLSNKLAYPNILLDTYLGKIGMSEEDCKKLWSGKTGLGGFNIKQNWLLTEEEVIEVIRKETKRLKV